MKTLLSKLAEVWCACAKHDDCCEIPETVCPPRCVGELSWTIQRGAFAKGTVLVRNVGKVAREFGFSATPLAGFEQGTATLKVQPALAHLEPGETQVVHVELLGSASMRACQDYRAELLIKGAWEQCVCVRLHVQRDAFDQVSTHQSDSLATKALHAEHLKATIDWKLQRGVTPEAAITIHNTGASMCTLTFEASPLVGVAAPGAALSLLPDSMQLPAGHTGVLRLRLLHSEALAPGHGYQGSVSIHGFYRQRVDVHAFVQPDAFDHAEIEQGEPPTRLRAHHWHDHFQCTERCAVLSA
jgi:hypothetical protein